MVTRSAKVEMLVAEHDNECSWLMHAVPGRLLPVAYWHSYPDWPAHRTARGPEARSHRCRMQMPKRSASAEQLPLRVLAEDAVSNKAGVTSNRPHMHRLPATPGGQRCNRGCTGNMFAGVRGCSGRQRVWRPRFRFCLRAVTSTSHGGWPVVSGDLAVKYGLWCGAC
jgi:hypothetical protein